jgi:hypothetical protein
MSPEIERMVWLPSEEAKRKSIQPNEKTKEPSMKRSTLLGIALLPLLVALPSRGGPMDEYSRKGKWEVYGMGLYDYISPADVSVDVYCAGVGVGYNFIDQLNAHFEFIAGGASASDNTSFSIFSGNLSVYGGDIGLDYNILKKPLTPFVGIGLGYWRFSSGDAYQGYLLAYAGLGLRWDINDRWFAKAEYRLSSMTTVSLGEDVDTAGNGIFLSAGYKF